jgi:hypothetical protein
MTPLAALLAVLTLASSAWAACAWVLWDESVFINVPDQPPVQNIGPSMRGAFESYAACVATSQKKAEADAHAY